MSARGHEKFVVAPEHSQDGRLDGKRDEIGKHNREGHHQTWEINLAEKLGIGREGAGHKLESLCVIVPGEQAAEVEENRRQAVGGDPGKLREDEREHDRHDERLHDRPGGTERGLLIARDKIAAHEQREQIAKFPERAQIDPQPVLIWPDANFEVGFLRRSHAIIGPVSDRPNRSIFSLQWRLSSTGWRAILTGKQLMSQWVVAGGVDPGNSPARRGQGQRPRLQRKPRLKSERFF